MLDWGSCGDRHSGGAGIPAGMPRYFESESGGVAPLDHRLHAGMPPAFLWIKCRSLGPPLGPHLVREGLVYAVADRDG